MLSQKTYANGGEADPTRRIKAASVFVPVATPAEQPQRIAEYNRGSAHSLEATDPSRSTSPGGDKDEAPRRMLRKQKTEPILNYTPPERQVSGIVGHGIGLSLSVYLCLPLCWSLFFCVSDSLPFFLSWAPSRLLLPFSLALPFSLLSLSPSPSLFLYLSLPLPQQI